MHSAKIKPIKQMLRDTLGYIIKGGLRIKNGHLPVASHEVPADFIGVCVASNEDPEVDHFILAQLETLGIDNVRLDFSYADLDNFNERFLKKLLADNINITLHLILPFDAAKHIDDYDEQQRWRTFLSTALDRYESQVNQIEIGNTINRKRWSGYSFNRLLTMWQIAYEEVKSRNLILLGPNIQDFEPMYNIGILKTLQARNQLPDIQTNNLFVERVSEPERFDHRILKYKWSKLFKYNLIKKARILRKIGLHFGVEHLTSSAAFWAIYRINRLIENGVQKQADYLTRYFTLLAASGALKQANWGALICNREGLINDGLSDAEYPDLERIAHYQSADGFLNQYERYPSFYAMQTLNKLLAGARYQSAIASAAGLEIHHFTNTRSQVHVAWTINGKIAYLADIYSKNTLNNVTILDRDGESLTKNTELICEKPIFLCWNLDFKIETDVKPKLAKDLAIHAHIEGMQYYRYTINGWSGLILAKDKTEADMLKQSLNPNLLEAPQKDQSLRHARNVIWAMTDPRNENAKLTVKQPVKMYPHKAFFDRFKPSKAKRSWNGAMELLRRGVNTAQPVAYFEKVGDSTLKQNFYFCAHVNADCSIGQIFSAFARGELTYHGLSPEEVYQQFAAFTHHMHSRGIYFRDYSGGNILISIQNDNQLVFSLIDTARLRSLNHSLSLKLRTADLTRACHKLHPAGRKRFMQIYLGLSGRKYNLLTQLRFLRYDLKVKLKRTIGRKGIKRLIQRLKQNR